MIGFPSVCHSLQYLCDSLQYLCDSPERYTCPNIPSSLHICENVQIGQISINDPKRALTFKTWTKRGDNLQKL